MPDAVTRPFALESVAYNDPRALAMRAVMDEEMGARYGTHPVPAGVDPAEFDAKVTAALAVDPATIVATVIALDAGADGTPLGHAALRRIGDEWEVKRVIVTAAARGRGVATALMTELERVAAAEGAKRVILQTGDRQPEAVALYEKLGFTRIPIYEPYVEAIPFSICFEKAV
ncbi:GNAT family N-acetyltransferase [Subtercola endophyticus]|uniref:GNAT family N-acetyltransferase n=1 Tax=Subtercola endophyticus TaxID=2895559 RepID=UPI001E45BA89|nr:GNAT family N-acetyltransferase [Subtercola endophyticus]UFS59226.1 GNAT family N-acetyltransferase [Subtercola endophyticus]